MNEAPPRLREATPLAVGRGRARFRRLALRGATLVAVLSGQAAAAGADLLGFRPPNDPLGGLYLEPTDTPGPGNVNLGLWFGYDARPLRLVDTTDEETTALISNRVAADLALRIGLGEQLALGLSLPAVPWQTGDGDEAAGLPVVPHAALGDLGLELKLDILSATAPGGLRLGLLGTATMPTGNAQAFAGNGSVAGELRALAELRLVNLGARATLGLGTREPREIAGAGFGDWMPWGFGLTYRPLPFSPRRRGEWVVLAEVFGEAALAPDAFSQAASPAMVALSNRFLFEEWSLLAGAALALDSAAGTPLVRAVAGLGWAPRSYDADGDGLGDEEDECPISPETRNGFEDGDGCPDDPSE